MRILLLVTALLTALVTPAHGAPGKLHVVEVKNSQFTPDELHIKRFDRVKWVFKGPGVQSVRRGLDSARPCKPSGGLDSGPKKPGETYTHQFTKYGKIPVFDEVNDGCRKSLLGWVGVSSTGGD